MLQTSLRYLAVVAFAANFSAASALADATTPIDWTSVPVEEVTLFYPGQSSLQWLHSPEHPGARMLERGTACTDCHRDSERRMAGL